MNHVLTSVEAQEARQLVARLAELLKEGTGTLAPVPSPAPPERALTLRLTPADFAAAAARLGCVLPAIYAADEVESGGEGFDDNGLLTVLYEPHVFSRETKRRFDDTHGGVSYAKWKTKPYPTGTLEERNKANWAKILYAAKLDETAAYRSASYGRFQVMGFNHAVCGFPTVGAFVAAMKTGEAAHLEAFVAYVIGNHLDDELRALAWRPFAAGYNGPGAADVYAGKLARAFAKHSGSHA